MLFHIAIAHAVQINTNLPGSAPATSPEGIVANFYQFALLIGALLAFGAIVFGGVKYALSAGSPGGQSDAKSWITDALLGLLLLLGAWLLLNVINPDLTRLRLPALNRLPTGTTPLTCGAGPACGPGRVCKLVAGQYRCNIIIGPGSTCNPNNPNTGCISPKVCKLTPPTISVYSCQNP